MILRNAFRGACRFGDWAETLNIPRAVLTHRLEHLVESGVMERRPYQLRPERFEYRLTAMGRDLWAYLLSIWSWERQWTPGARRRMRRLVHATCGAAVMPVICCAACGEPLEPDSVIEQPGPGAGTEPRNMPRWQRRTVLVELHTRNDGQGQMAWHILGDRWSTILLHHMARGATRFATLRDSMQVRPPILAQRLRDLTAQGLIEARSYSSQPPRNEYRLTPMGVALHQTRLLAMAWGDRWLSGDAGVPAVLVHQACGHVTHAQLRCSDCDEVLSSPEIRFEPRIDWFDRRHD